MIGTSTSGLRIKMSKNTTIGFTPDELKSIVKTSNGDLNDNSTLQELKAYLFRKSGSLTNRMMQEEKHRKIIEDLENGKKKRIV